VQCAGITDISGVGDELTHIVMCSVCLPCFLSYYKRHNFRKKKVYQTLNVCFDVLHNFLSQTFLTLRRIERVTVKMLRSKYMLVFTSTSCYFCPILMKLEIFFRQILKKNTQLSNFMKIA
jgi:hypothetical protein